MKLSEAIRKGAKRVPQCYGEIVRRPNLSSEVEAACALGAALIGATGKFYFRGKINDHLYPVLKARFPILSNQLVERPGKDQPFTLEEAIIHLNDSVAWTREQIADWLESHGQ